MAYFGPTPLSNISYNGDVIANASGARVKEVGGATVTLTNADHGFLLLFTAECEVTIPTGLREDFSCGWVQGSANSVSFTPAVGVTLNEPDDYSTSIVQWAAGGITSLGSESYLLLGRLGS